MSEDSLNLVLQKQSNKTSSGITKIQIKSEKHTSFGGIFPIMEKFDRMLSHTTQVMMHTWWPSNLILGSLKSSCPSPGSGWGRNKDEDDDHWWRRCIAVSAAMMQPAKYRLQRGRRYKQVTLQIKCHYNFIWRITCEERPKERLKTTENSRPNLYSKFRLTLFGYIPFFPLSVLQIKFSLAMVKNTRHLYMSLLPKRNINFRYRWSMSFSSSCYKSKLLMSVLVILFTFQDH